MFRREWRQQLLVVTLLTVAVAAAVGSITIVYNASPADNAEFGSANDRADVRRHRSAQARGRARRRREIVRDDGCHRPPLGGRPRQRRDGGLPRAGPATAPTAGELLALRRGSYPAGPGEVAVTDGVAELLRLEIGSTLALDGAAADRRRHRREPAQAERRVRARLALVRARAATTSRFWSTRATRRSSPSSDSVARRRSAFAGIRGSANDQRGGHAGDVLRGHRLPPPGLAGRRRGLRRRRAATAPPARHARRRSAPRRSTSGSCCSPTAPSSGRSPRCSGRSSGSRSGSSLAPTLESAVDHRIDRLSLPWALIAPTVAPRGPRRDRRRLVAGANGRPPPRHARALRAAAEAEARAPLGDRRRGADRGRHRLSRAVRTATAAADRRRDRGDDPRHACSWARWRSASSPASPGASPIAPRLALRDLVRYQARSGAALAAVTLALGIAATVVVIASAEEAKKAAEPPNLSDRQIRVYLGPPEAPGELTPVDAPAQLDAPGRPRPTARRANSTGRP